MLITVRQISSCLCSTTSLNHNSISKKQSFCVNPKNYVNRSRKKSFCRATLTIPTSNSRSSNKQSCGSSAFDPLGINPGGLSDLNTAWESVLELFSQTFKSTSGTRKDKTSSARGVAGFFDIFQLPSKILALILGISSRVHFLENFSSF